MTDDIAQGRNFPLYFYGQQFMGPLESYVLAPWVRILGSYYLTARLGNEIFYLIFLAGCFWVARKLFDQKFAVFILLLLALPPFPILFFTTLVGYGEILPLAIGGLILVLKLSSATEGGWGKAFALGFISGLAMWCNALFVVWLIPIGIAFLSLTPFAWKRKLPWGFLMGFLAGLFPVWIYGLQTGTPMNVHTAGNRFTSLENVPEHLYLFFARLKYFLTTSSYDPKSGLVRQVIACVSWFPLVCFAVSWAVLLFSSLKRRQTETNEKKIWQLFVLSPPVLLAALYISRELALDEGLRYMIPVFPSFVFATAWGIHRVRPAFLKQAVLISLGLILLGSSAVSLKAQAQIKTNYLKILEFLDRQGLHYGVGDLGVSYAVNALSRGRILMSPHRQDARSGRLWKTVRENQPNFFVFERVGHRFRSRLESDPRVTWVPVGGRDVYYGPSKIFIEILECRERLDLT